LYETKQPAASFKAYRRAFKLSKPDAGLVSEFFCRVLEEEKVDGFLRELAAFDQSRLGQDPRLNAVASSMNSWLFLAGGDEKTSSDYLAQAMPYVILAYQQLGPPQTDKSASGSDAVGKGTFVSNDRLVCAVILHSVAEKLGDSKRAATAMSLLRRF